MVAFHRQWVPNIGASSSAWTRMSSTVSGWRNRKTVSSGKRVLRARARAAIASSVAAAWSSKLNWRQNRLRSARPQARFTRLPNGEWMTSCMPPASSKNRSATMVSWVGRAPSMRLDSAR